MKKLVVVLGPTAIGKTAFSIELAKSLQTEIISCDSRQFFKELNIGVARPNDEELTAVPHHFIAHQTIQNLYSAGDFEKDALALLDALFLEKSSSSKTSDKINRPIIKPTMIDKYFPNFGYPSSLGSQKLNQINPIIIVRTINTAIIYPPIFSSNFLISLIFRD